MPLDTNIALGIRPPEQPNMLAQMGQMMQLRQMQQGFESENALRDFYAKGGDLSTPEGKRQLMALSPLAGMKLIGQQSEIASRDLGSTEKAIKLYKDQVGGVTDSASAASLIKAVYSNPLTRPFVESMAPLDKALAAIPNDPAALEKWKRGFGLTADKLFVDANTEATNQARIQAAGISAAPGHRQATVAEEKWKQEQDQLKIIQNIVSPERTSSATATPINMGGNGVQTTQAPPSGVAPVTPPVGAQTPATGAVSTGQTPPTGATTPRANALNPNVNVNALTAGSQKEQLVDQISQLARIPTTAASRALQMKVQEFNVLYPTEKIEQDKQGNLITIVNGVSKPVVNANGLPVQGKPLPETAFESTVGRKTGEDLVAFVKRVEAAPKNIAKIDEVLGILKSGGAVTGFGAETRLNLERAMSLFGNDVKSGKRVVDTQILDALLGSDVFPSLQSMGLGSKNIDTPNEREFIRQVITGTISLDNNALIRLTQIRRNVETDAIKEYNQKLESGKFDKYSKAADQKLEKIEAPNPIIRKGTHKNGRSVIEYADGTIEYGN